MDIASCQWRTEHLVRCACGGAAAAHRLARGVAVAACADCGRWFTVSRVCTRRRIADLLVRAVSSYAHPDDVVFVPWAPF
jgi:hypothetical protein